MKPIHTAVLSTLLLLILGMLLSCTASDPPAETEAPETLPPSHLVLKDGATDYAICRAEFPRDWELEAAKTLKRRMTSLLGTSVPMHTDFVYKNGMSDRTEKEIIVGKIADEGTVYQIDREKLGDFGYVIVSAGDKIVIAAENGYALNRAIEVFLSDWLGLSEGDNSGKTVMLTDKTEYYTGEELNTGKFEVSYREDLVGICYSVWFDMLIDISGQNQPNIQKALDGTGSWGPETAFHYWNEPALGYYRSSDKSVIRTHLEQFIEAQVDFIIIDYTYLGIGYKQMPSLGSSYNRWQTYVSHPIKAMMEVMNEMRAEEKNPPPLCFWIPFEGNFETLNELRKEFISVPEYGKNFVYWDDKPFVLSTNVPDKDPEGITWRKMWGLQPQLEPSEWSFLKNDPKLTSYDASGSPEQVGVNVAHQSTYMSLPTATGRRGGLTFWECWKTAFEKHPKFVTITWWNEWAAQRLSDGNGGYFFVDNYNNEYSRDIEPMKGGHGDTYYQWLKQYIAAYKNGEECPRLVEEGK